MTPGPGIELGPHCWEASALTTALSLLPKETRVEVWEKGEMLWKREPLASVSTDFSSCPNFHRQHVFHFF